ncbi:HxlR family transcriptional regulator [Pectobacterium carotovorum subsp. carotovorum]|nr:HxlR family transcriptional regulator [Pectobacterium carotovorum subsp. carotovorum]
MVNQQMKKNILPTKRMGLEESLMQGTLHSVECPSREILKHITSLWGVLILLALRADVHRYSELKRKAPGVSEKMLTQTLRTLEKDGLVKRTSYDVVPPHVTYELTKLGSFASTEVSRLVAWIENNQEEMMRSR